MNYAIVQVQYLRTGMTLMDFPEDRTIAFVEKSWQILPNMLVCWSKLLFTDGSWRLHKNPYDWCFVQVAHQRTYETSDRPFRFTGPRLNGEATQHPYGWRIAWPHDQSKRPHKPR